MENVRQADQLLAFVNPKATANIGAEQKARALAASAGIDTVTVLTDFPSSELVRTHVSDKQTVIYTGGGDGTVNATVSAILGHEVGDPEATAKNNATHTKLAKRVLYVAGADGGANNFPLSALGRRFAKRPQFIPNGKTHVAQHRPLIFEVWDDEADKVVQSGIATTCIGLGGTALTLVGVEAAKPKLAQHPYTRLLRETAMTAKALVAAPAFSAEATFTDRTGIEKKQKLDNISAIELIGSRNYAKQGRGSAGVNIDTAKWQPVTLERRPSRLGRWAAACRTLAQVALGRYQPPQYDFAGHTELRLRVTSDQPVPFHTDGDVHPDRQLTIGQTLALRLSKIAIPTVMA